MKPYITLEDRLIVPVCKTLLRWGFRKLALRLRLWYLCKVARWLRDHGTVREIQAFGRVIGDQFIVENAEAVVMRRVFRR